MVQEWVAVATQAANTNRVDAERIRGELNEAKNLCRRLTLLLVDPAIAEGAKPVISCQLGDAGDRLKQLQASLDRMLYKTNDDTDELAAIPREKLTAARDRWNALAAPAHLNALVREFVGPSRVTTSGHLLPVGATKKPVHAINVHGVVGGSQRRSEPGVWKTETSAAGS